MNGLGALKHNIARTTAHYQTHGLRRTLVRGLLELIDAPQPVVPADDYRLPFILPLNVEVCRDTGRRINLLIPSLERRHVYGGIATALALFEKLSPYFDKARLVVTDSPGGDYDPASYKKYELAFVNDRRAKRLLVGAGDVFIASAWWTAYILQAVLSRQQDEFGKHNPHYFYLIQDFEPGFYAWSSLYALAETTYRTSHPTVAIFNTEGLRVYFKGLGYQFLDSVSFQPAINRALLSGVETAKRAARKQPYQIIVYGRPSVDRNCFPLIIEALRIWCRTYSSSNQWSIISAGEGHPDIILEDGLCVRAAGKLSLADYQKLLCQSSVGLSLMISPHPSYPPLEMAAYGLEVVTNSFGNKDLSRRSGNITSIELITPENIAVELAQACRRVELWQGQPSPVDDSLIGTGNDYEALIERIRGYF